MPQLRVALAQVDPTVGDLAGNAEQVLRWTRHAADQGAHLVAFPEMVLTGYPVEDLALRPSFVRASRGALDGLAGRLAEAGLGEQLVVVGYLDGAQDAVPMLGTPAGAPQNAAALIHHGRVVGRYAKHHLPNYGVFDEYRYFVPGASLTVARLHGVDVAVVICEDIWQEGGPVAAVRDAGAGLLVVINGSPYERHKDDTRLDLARRRAAAAGCTLAYVNMVGGQDDLVFDGGSFVIAPDGQLLARSPQFVEDLLLWDLPASDPDAAPHADADARPPVPRRIAPPLHPDEEIYRALETGLAGYVRKNGFRSVVLGLSGGIDSALVAAIAADALGGDRVVGVSMPSRHSSGHSRDDAADLAERIGADLRTQAIGPMVDAFESEMALEGLAAENLQARVRGVILMALSNLEGHLVLATGNKTELAVGYSTIYGDAVGGYAPLKDVDKSRVWALARWRNTHAVDAGQVPPIPESSITKEPSAELRPDQRDQDSLPPYEVLDDLLEHYVVGAQGRSELLAAGFDAGTVDDVVRLVDRAEWKRRQFAPGTKISAIAFGRDRRLPITTSWREERSR